MSTTQTTYQGFPGPAMRAPVPGTGQRLKTAVPLLKSRDAEPSLWIIVSFFLGLASVAVVVVTGQFPWFILAPGIVVLLISYFRYAEARHARSLDKLKQPTY